MVIHDLSPRIFFLLQVLSVVLWHKCRDRPLVLTVLKLPRHLDVLWTRLGSQEAATWTVCKRTIPLAASLAAIWLVTEPDQVRGHFQTIFLNKRRYDAKGGGGLGP